MKRALSLNDLGDRMLLDSRRWFPNLHHTDHAAAVHFALGLFGEIGELLLCDGDDPDEVADVAVYTLDLARILGCDLDDASVRLPDVGTEPVDAAIAAGLAVNKFKKVNRGDMPLDDAREQIADHLATVIAVCRNLVDDLFAAIESKNAICEQRWGTTP